MVLLRTLLTLIALFFETEPVFGAHSRTVI